MNKLHSINSDQRLYVLTCSGGYTCLGFDVCQDRMEKLCKELGYKVPPLKKGTAKHYNAYCLVVEAARVRNQQTGWRSLSELNPNLIGLEGKRIEAILYGEKARFWVGKSTGFIPCHLEIKTKRSIGGASLPADPSKLQVLKVLR